jgi:hypothetical protein
VKVTTHLCLLLRLRSGAKPPHSVSIQGVHGDVYATDVDSEYLIKKKIKLLMLHISRLDTLVVDVLWHIVNFV